MKIFKFKIDQADNLMRLDKFLYENIEGLSRSYIKKLINNKDVSVNKKHSKPSYKIKENDKIEVLIPEKEDIYIESEDINLDIIYENKDYLIINKDAGVTVHPSEGNLHGTLVNGLLNLNIPLSDIEGDLRPGIVHRLDKDTSGLLIACKTNQMHMNIKKQLLDRTMEREYLVLVHGIIKDDSGQIDAPIGRNKKDRRKRTVIFDGREAISNFEVIKRFKGYTFLKISLESGRTHQIRVHMSYINHPVVGDNMYGLKNDKVKNLMLHSFRIGFNDLDGIRKYFSKPINDKFSNILKNIDN